jgi:hypothetical protein
VVLYFLAILYSVVFGLCSLRLAPYLLVGKKEQEEMRRSKSLEDNNEEEKSGNAAALNLSNYSED